MMAFFRSRSFSSCLSIIRPQISSQVRMATAACPAPTLKPPSTLPAPIEGPSKSPFGVPYHAHKRILFSAYRNLLTTSPLVCVVEHQNLTAQEWIKVKKALKDQLKAKQEGQNQEWELKLCVTKTAVLRAALRETSFVNLSPLLHGPVALIYASPSSEGASDYDLPKMAKGVLDVLHKTPKLVLVGGKCENRLISSSGLTQVSHLPAKSSLQAELLGVLESPARILLGYLQQGPQSLVLNLESRIKDMSESKGL